MGGMFIFLSIYAVNQAQVQRLLATRSLKSAQKALWLQWPILAALSCITSFAGLVMYAYYKGLYSNFVVFNTRDVLARVEENGGAGGAIAPPIFLEIGKILPFSTPNIPRSK